MSSPISSLACSKVCGGRQDLRELAGQLLVGPQPVRGGTRLVLVFCPADLHPAGDEALVVGCVAEALDFLLIGDSGAVSIADPRGKAGGLGAKPGDEDRREPLRQVVDARVLHAVVAAAVALHPALPKPADDLHGLLEHLKAFVGPRPVVAEDVLVERLPAAEPEREAALEQHRGSRGGLRDDRRVDAHGRAGDGGRQLDLRGGLGERPDRRPHEAAVSLLIVPGVEVVGDPQQAGEAGVLGHARLSDELARVELLA